ncbi:myosin-2 [Drosophila albomicans]|uniref:Myosin-2 n=1 Tax=Drosophila albomicans TaxID=7291 RepID=A0A9C6SRM1_DROAB|nr:myosin-2 [Drosophila albomicans]
MIIPAINESNPTKLTTTTTNDPSLETGHAQNDSMARHQDINADNPSAVTVKPMVKKQSYNNLQQCQAAVLNTINSKAGAPAASNETTSGDDYDEEELTLSEGEPFGSQEDEDDMGSRINKHGDEIGSKLKLELSKYKQELHEYNETTKDLEKKYMKINLELTEMQQKHHKFVHLHDSNAELELRSDGIDGVEEHAPLSYVTSNTSMTSSDLRHKNAKMFGINSNSSSFMTVMEAPSSAALLLETSGKKRPKSSKLRRNLAAQVDVDYRPHIVGALTKRQTRQGRGGIRTAQDLLEEQENEPSIKEMYCVLKDVINTSKEHNKYSTYDRNRERHRERGRERDRDQESGGGDYTQLYTTIKDLKSEQQQYRNIIRQQQERISDYHTRCVKAQDIMKTQKHEIDKLQVNNKQLESSIYLDIDTLRSKIDSKLKSVAKLPHMMREEHSKYEKVMRENCLMAEKLHELQKEANLLKAKIDELGKRKLITVNRLKAAERDLKIFKNYNASLKTEKRRMADELQTMKEQLDSLQAASKRQLTRHREQTEKQRRELQKRIYDLELKLSRSQNSTSSLIQERDSLIAELQTQLHTLVHNFEVSQKHIRVLRRHIYSMTSGGGGSSVMPSSSSHRRSPSESNMVRANQLISQHQVHGQPSVSASRLSSPRMLKTRSS